MNYFIELKNIYKTYQTGDINTNAINGVSLGIKENEFISIVGTSGSGKSTLMNIIGCLDYCSSGEYYLSQIAIHNKNVSELAKIRNQYIGFVFQQYFLLPELKVLENVELPLLYRGIPQKKRLDIAFNSLRRLGIEEKANMYPVQLSGGQQQRVAIARALSVDPPLILADEPTGALDSNTSNEVLDIFEDLHKNGKTIIMVTHDQSIAQRAKKIVTIEDGKIKKINELE